MAVAGVRARRPRGGPRRRVLAVHKYRLDCASAVVDATQGHVVTVRRTRHSGTRACRKLDTITPTTQCAATTLQEFGLLAIHDTMPNRRRGKLRTPPPEEQASLEETGESLAPVPYHLAPRPDSMFTVQPWPQSMQVCSTILLRLGCEAACNPVPDPVHSCQTPHLGLPRMRPGLQFGVAVRCRPAQLTEVCACGLTCGAHPATG